MADDFGIFMTRAELLKGRKQGLHKSDSPLIAYKKIFRVETIQTFFFGKKVKCTKGIATLEIPAGSTIVRPGHCSYDEHGTCDRLLSNELRADNAIFEHFEPTENVTCLPYFLQKNISQHMLYASIYDPKYEYTMGQNHKPREKLNKNDIDWNGSGINFFLNKDEAANYPI
jgi:hypothetical protein